MSGRIDGAQRQVAVLRSMLFVPGHRADLMTKAARSEADALILDLEDSVPPPLKKAGREAIAAFLHDHESQLPVFVRINELASDAAHLDLRAAVAPGLAGIVVPKIAGPDDVRVLDRVLGWLEAEAGMPGGSVCIAPLIETAMGIRNAFEIGSSSTRVAYMCGIGARGGDVERTVGFRWTRSGDSTSHIRAKVLLDARAAFTQNPVAGLWTDLKDLDGLRDFANANRDLGYEGMIAIHPSHVPVINEVFSPSDEEISHLRALCDEYDRALANGIGVIDFRGDMVDAAMARAARERLNHCNGGPSGLVAGS